MKRKSEVGSGSRLGDILTATSVEQRAWIGAVVLAYNDAEGALHRLTGACLGLDASNNSVTSRINGTDGLVAIIHETVDAIGLPNCFKHLYLSKGLLNLRFCATPSFMPNCSTLQLASEAPQASAVNGARMFF
jgi:hypothetical protein